MIPSVEEECSAFRTTWAAAYSTACIRSSVGEGRARFRLRILLVGAFTLIATNACASLGLVSCMEPVDRRPGLRLGGEVVEEGGGDWSFTDAHREIAIETRSPWLLPHSVTIVCSAKDGRFFIGARDPDGKRWVKNVDRDPDVRLKIGGRVYEQRLVALEDAEDVTAAYESYTAKYGEPETPPDQRPPIRYFEVVARR